MDPRSKLAGLAAVAVCLAGLAGSALYAAFAQQTVEMHVERLGVGWAQTFGRNRSTEAIVRIVDQSGGPVAAAAVTGSFSGCYVKNNVSGTTNSDGWVAMKGQGVNCNQTGPCDLTFEVKSVAKIWATYDEPANVVTSATTSFLPVTTNGN
jgi:hypothetical protein